MDVHPMDDALAVRRQRWTRDNSVRRWLPESIPCNTKVYLRGYVAHTVLLRGPDNAPLYFPIACWSNGLSRIPARSSPQSSVRREVVTFPSVPDGAAQKTFVRSTIGLCQLRLDRYMGDI